MHELLVITSEAPERRLPGFGGQQVTSAHMAESMRIVRERAFDCVLVQMEGDEQIDVAQVKTLRTERLGEWIPVVLLADGSRETSIQLFQAAPFDDFMDSRWSSQLLEECLLRLIDQFKTKREEMEAHASFLEGIVGEAERLQEMASQDDLTRLNNRRHFAGILEKEHARCVRFSEGYVLAFIDVDGLKEVNSAHGHLAGSQVLTEVGRQIADVSRRRDHAFRYGGDEFVLLLVGTDAKGAMAYSKRLCRSVEETGVQFGPHLLKVTISVGLAVFPDHGKSPREVMSNADKALFDAKKQGKNNVALFRPSGDT